MKAIVTAIAAISLFTGAAYAQGMGASAPVNNSVCLDPYMVDHTTTVDANTLLFHMKDGKIWKNTLKGACPGLKFHGFVYVTRADEICSNAQAISVIETHEACALGQFTPYTPQHAGL